MIPETFRKSMGKEKNVQYFTKYIAKEFSDNKFLI